MRLRAPRAFIIDPLFYIPQKKLQQKSPVFMHGHA